jgi:cytochrome c oxidase cbb3-type subunit 3
MNEQIKPDANQVSPIDDPLTSHAYDGIQEYDNPIPGWWNWIFIGTIVFSVFYYFFVTMAGGDLSPIGFYERDLLIEQKGRLGELGSITGDDATVLKLSTDPKWMGLARSLYVSNCTNCHGKNGEGNNGPNLTDDHYIHVKTPADIVDVLNKGRNNGAMPAWSNRFDPRETILLSAYVTSMRGQNLPGRPPEGKVIDPWKAE